MKEDLWNGTLADGRLVKYGYKELSDGVAVISAKVDGRLTMVVQKDISAPMTRRQVEAAFEENFRVAQSAR